MHETERMSVDPEARVIRHCAVNTYVVCVELSPHQQQAFVQDLAKG